MIFISWWWWSWMVKFFWREYKFQNRMDQIISDYINDQCFPNENKKKIILQIFIRILLKKFSQIFKCELIFLFYFLWIFFINQFYFDWFDLIKSIFSRSNKQTNENTKMLFRNKISLTFLAIVALQMILIQDQMTAVSARKKWLRKLLFLCTLLNKSKLKLMIIIIFFLIYHLINVDFFICFCFKSKETKIIPLPLPLPIPIPLR